ncbi:MAG: AsmA family protein [Rhodobacteraceae bacterium]|nr:AsmA family protein [Paracoccaceae bacterium]
MRWLIRIFFGLLVLAVAALAALFLLPSEKIAKLLTDQFEAATGRAMTLQGDPRPSLWPELGVSTGPVTVANASWGSAAPLLQAEDLSVGVDIMALLGGSIHINRVDIVSPRLVLELAADGRGNWEMGSGSEPTTGGSSGGLPAFALDRAVLRGGRLSFIDHGRGSRTDLTDVDATIRLPDVAGEAKLEMSAAMAGSAFELEASVARFAEFLSSGAVPVTLDFSAGGSSIGFDGRVGLSPLAVGGQLDADLGDPGAVFGLAGLAAPDLPHGLGQSMGLKGVVTFTEAGGVTLRDGTIRLDHNTLTGSVDITLADKPRVTAQLAAAGLDFSALTGGETPDPPADAGPTGWPRDRIDASALQSLDAQIALAASSIDLGIAKLGKTVILTKLDNGRAVTEISELAAYDGSFAGSFVVNSRGGLSARANLTGTGFALQPFLTDMADYDRLLATGDLSVSLLAVGNDMAALMSSLSGEGALNLGQGELRGLDLAGMLRNLDTSHIGEGAKTIFESISGTFKVDQGVLRNDDLRMTAPLLNADGKGRVGIGAQDLDYRVTAALLEGQTNGGLRVPLMITGPWSDPKFRLDLQALAEQELADDVEELRDRAEEVVKDKLKEELGVEVETLEEAGDALKEELEDRVRDGLMDLLGGN